MVGQQCRRSSGALQQRHPRGTWPMGCAEYLSLETAESTCSPGPQAHAQAQRDRGLEQHAADRLASVSSAGALIQTKIGSVNSDQEASTPVQAPHPTSNVEHRFSGLHGFIPEHPPDDRLTVTGQRPRFGFQPTRVCGWRVLIGLQRNVEMGQQRRDFIQLIRI